MLTPRAELAEASARDGRRSPRTLIEQAYAQARAGLITQALADIAEVRHDPDVILSDLEHAAMVTPAIECRLARGEFALAARLGDELGRIQDNPGLTGAIAHFGRGE